MRAAIGFSLLVTFALSASASQVHTSDVPLHHEDERVSVTLAVESATILEHEGSALDVKLVADKPVSDRLIVQLKLGGTATRDLDYEIASTRAVFERGMEITGVRLEPLRDWIWEGDETIQLEIVSFLRKRRDWFAGASRNRYRRR